MLFQSILLQENILVLSPSGTFWVAPIHPFVHFFVSHMNSRLFFFEVKDLIKEGSDVSVFALQYAWNRYMKQNKNVNFKKSRNRYQNFNISPVCCRSFCVIYKIVSSWFWSEVVSELSLATHSKHQKDRVETKTI